MPQFDVNSNKNLLFFFSVLFVFFIYSSLIILFSLLKIINFNLFLSHNNYEIELYSINNLKSYNLVDDIIFNELDNIFLTNEN